MGRSKWKHYYLNNMIFKKIILLKINEKINSRICIFIKSLTIPIIFLNKAVSIYKGKHFRRLVINKYVIGYKFGNFTFTRKPFIYPIKKKKKKFIKR